MSVTRRSYCSDADLNKQIKDRLEAKPGRAFGALIAARADQVAGLLAEGCRAFCIYDTAKPLNKAHADICQAHSPPGRAERRRFRRNLRDLFVVYPWIYVRPPDMA